MEIKHDFQSIRNEICNWLYVVTAICGVPFFLVSVLRASSIGWHWISLPQFAFPLIALAFLLFRHSTPYALRAGYFVFLCVALGIFGMARYGLLAAGIPALIIAPGIAVILFGVRTGVACIVFILSVTSLIAVAKLSGWLESDFDPAAYVRLTPSWMMYLMSSFITMVVSLTAIVKIVRHLTSALKLSAKNSDELEELVIQRTQELEKAKIEAESLARTDALTGIKNRRAFYELAQMLDEQARRSLLPYSILMIDIDHFKLFNDEWGHQGGDNVLIYVSELIVRVARSSDVVARLGGEEFAVMLPDTSMENALVLAEKLRQSVENTPIQAPEVEIRVTVSIGIAMLEATAVSFEEVISHADAALYQAKRTGRNRVCCYQGEIATG